MLRWIDQLTRVTLKRLQSLMVGCEKVPSCDVGTRTLVEFQFQTEFFSQRENSMKENLKLAMIRLS